MRVRAFLIGYEPVRLRLTKEVIDSLMKTVDVCVAAPQGVPIGANLDTSLGRMRYVGHEHHGKIVILERAP